MPTISVKYPPPEDWPKFQRLCQRVLQRLWHSGNVEIYGRVGQKQHGVDLLDVSGTRPLRAGQCKLYDASKSLSDREIRAEVQKAETFPVELDFYLIMTTAQMSTESQLAVLAINREHKEKGLFEVGLMGWGAINDFLNENSDIAEEFYGGLSPHSAELIDSKLEEVRTIARSTLERVSVSASLGGIDGEIDLAKTHIEKYDYQVARVLLERLRERHWSDLTDRQKFRVVTNLATARLMQGDIAKAAALYLEAKLYQLDDQKAWENEVLAHQLLDEPEKAFDLADRVRERWPQSGRATAIWVANSPRDRRVADLEAEIPVSLLEDVEVCLVMARRAAAEGDFLRAERFSRVACSALPQRAYPVCVLGQVLLGVEMHGIWVRHAEVAIQPNSPKMREAETCFTEAISRAEAEKLEEVQVQALLGRSFIRDALGDAKRARQDIEEAYRTAPDNPSVLARYSTLLSERGDTEGALASLRKAVAKDGAESAFLLATVLRQRGTDDDLREALKLLRGIAATSERITPGLREHVVGCAIDAARKLGKLEELESILSEIPAETVSPMGITILRARLALARDQRELATTLSDEALKGMASKASSDDKRNLAILFSELGRYHEALPFWQELAPTTVLTPDTRRLLDCALRLGRQGLALDVCRILRQNGFEDADLFETEVGILERYDPDAAVELIQEKLQHRPEDKTLRLHLSVIGLRIGRAEIVSGDPVEIPPAAEVPPLQGRAAVWVMRMTGHPEEAVRYAYDLLRRHFGDIEANRAYRASMDPLGPDPNIPAPQIVGSGTAVCFVEEGTTTERWVVIEDAFEPDSKLDEVSSDSLLAQNLDGKRVGESFTLAEGKFVGFGRTGVVRQVLSKYVFRYQECITQWEIRFPDSPEIQMFRLSAAKPADGEQPDFAPVIEALKRKRESTQEIEKIYSSQLAPIHLVAEAKRLSDLQALAGLADSDEVQVRCCAGSAQERDEALGHFASSAGLVLDVTAIATLTFLNLLQILSDLPMELVVSRSTMDEIQKMLFEEKHTSGARTGTLGLVGGRLTMVEHTDDYKKAHLDSLETLVSTLRDRCKVRDCVRLAYLDPNEREQLIKLFGQHGAESMILASELGHLLWSDDYVLAEYAKAQYGVRRVWTQVVLQARAKQGAVEPLAFFDATAKLAGYGYFFTSLNTPSLMRAGELAKWNPAAWPLKQVLRQFGVESIALLDTVRLATEFIVQLYREDIFPDHRTAVLIATLENLAGRSGGVDAVRQMVRSLPVAFGLNVVRGEEAVRAMEAWLKQRRVMSR
jgi:tetratricopeptide (TPR) repeat protein